MTTDPKGPIRKRRTRAEVRRLVAEFLASGMQQSDFCRSRRLSSGTLHRHLKKRRNNQQGGTVSTATRLVQVELAPRRQKQSEPNCPITVVLLGGRRIEVGRDFDVPTFRRLVGALENS